MAMTVGGSTHRGAGGETSTGLLVPVAGFACLVVALQQTLVVPAVPRFPSLLNTSASVVSWMVTATLLTGAVATPIFGRLSDLFGKRRMMMLSMALVLVGSIIGPLGGVATVILGRALQGMGTALVPVAMAQMRDSLPSERVRSSLAVLSATLGVGGGVGIPLGGVILSTLGWQWMFWLSALLSVISISLIARVIPADQVDDSGRIDVVGAVLLAIGLLGLLVGVSQGGTWGWASARTLGVLLGGIVVLVAWGFYELRQSSPIVDLRVSGTRALLFTNLASILMGVLMFSNLLLTTVKLQGSPAQGGFGWTAAAAGLAMLPNALAMFGVAPLTARLAATHEPRTILQLGALITGVAYFLRAAASQTALLTIIWATVIGVGVGIGYAALPMLVVQHAPLREMGSANGVNALMRAIGTAVASAMVGTIGASLSITVAGRAVPSSAAMLAIALLGGVLALACLGFAMMAGDRTSNKDRHAAVA